MEALKEHQRISALKQLHQKIIEFTCFNSSHRTHLIRKILDEGRLGLYDENSVNTTREPEVFALFAALLSFSLFLGLLLSDRDTQNDFFSETNIRVTMHSSLFHKSLFFTLGTAAPSVVPFVLGLIPTVSGFMTGKLKWAMMLSTVESRFDLVRAAFCSIIVFTSATILGLCSESSAQPVSPELFYLVSRMWQNISIAGVGVYFSLKYCEAKTRVFSLRHRPGQLMLAIAWFIYWLSMCIQMIGLPCSDQGPLCELIRRRPFNYSTVAGSLRAVASGLYFCAIIAIHVVPRLKDPTSSFSAQSNFSLMINIGFSLCILWDYMGSFAFRSTFVSDLSNLDPFIASWWVLGKSLLCIYICTLNVKMSSVQLDSIRGAIRNLLSSTNHQEKQLGSQESAAGGE